MTNITTFTKEQSGALTPNEWAMALIVAPEDAELLWCEAVRDPWLYERQEDVIRALTENVGVVPHQRAAELAAILASGHRRHGTMAKADANMAIALGHVEKSPTSRQGYLYRKIGTEGAEISAKQGHFVTAAALCAKTAESWRGGRSPAQMVTGEREQMYRALRLSALHAFNARLEDKTVLLDEADEIELARVAILQAGEHLLMASSNPAWDVLMVGLDAIRADWLSGRQTDHRATLSDIGADIKERDFQAAFGWSHTILEAAQAGINTGSGGTLIQMDGIMRAARGIADDEKVPIDFRAEAMLAIALCHKRRGDTAKARHALKRIISLPGLHGAVLTLARELEEDPFDDGPQG